jgi:hypothetical protein
MFGVANDGQDTNRKDNEGRVKRRRALCIIRFSCVGSPQTRRIDIGVGRLHCRENLKSRHCKGVPAKDTIHVMHLRTEAEPLSFLESLMRSLQSSR